MATAEYINFTAARLHKLTPGDKVQAYKDKSLKGLQVVIYPGGTKTFEVYRKPRVRLSVVDMKNTPQPKGATA